MTVLKECLNMIKINAKWVPRILTPQMCLTQVDCCQELAEIYDSDPDLFASRVVTRDKFRIH